MATVVIDGLQFTLRAKATASANTISVSRASAIRLNDVGVGNRVYLAIKDRMNYELVQYDHSADWDSSDSAIVALPVVRDARGFGAKNFPYGACVVSEVNSLYIEDYIDEHTGGGS